MKVRYEIKLNPIDTAGNQTYSLWSSEFSGALITGTYSECLAYERHFILAMAS